MSKRPAVIVSLCDDDDEEEDQIQQAIKLSLAGRKKKPRTSPPLVIDLIDDEEDDDGGGKIGACVGLRVKNKASARLNVGTYASDNAEVVVIVPSNDDTTLEPPSTYAASTAAAGAQAADNDDEVQELGRRNVLRLPHMRQHCPDHRFVPDAFSKGLLTSSKAINEAHCDLCYCFVCDTPFKDCQSWSSASKNRPSNHCCASDKGADAYLWKGLRQSIKRNKERGTGATSSSASRPVAAPGTPTTSPPRPARVLRRSPYPPYDRVASQNQHLTMCRKCGWYSHFDHHNYNRTRTFHKVLPNGSRQPIQLPFKYRTSDSDWCHACGRVADQRDFSKEQSEPFTVQPSDIFLGTKVIPFRIQARDPRKFEHYKERWSQNGWAYSEAEMEEETFRHRFGKYPTLPMIMASIPVLANLPEAGRISMSSNQGDEFDSANKKYDISALETEALLLSDPRHYVFLDELHRFGAIGVDSKLPDIDNVCGRSGDEHKYVGGDIKAEWGRMGRKGKFTVRVFLKAGTFVQATNAPWFKSLHAGNASFARLLGALFKISPFPLSALSRGLVAKKSTVPRFRDCNGLPLPPWKLKDEKEKEGLLQKINEKEDRAISRHNESSQAFRDEVTFVASNGSNAAGGVCSSDTTLRGTLQRYFSEVIVDDALYRNEDMWRNSTMGLIAYHRSLLRHPGDLTKGNRRDLMKFRSYVEEKDHALLTENMKPSIHSIFQRTKTLNGLLLQLENLGHPACPPVEGLTVELLDFQRQAVGWALERETISGGVQALLWAKLPGVRAGNKDVYYCPILDMFSSERPRTVFGGWLAQMMGLGKTVISLALILSNPAPAIPESGSKVEMIDSSGNAGEGKGRWLASTEFVKVPGAPPERGTILSRGTLVICPVSLVGQWIDEAKSKLKDPGLIYPYHGGNRVRDPTVLARNAIVVTTFHTLASDYSRSYKSFAPCEMIRWWRVICDEGHCLKDTSTHITKAVMSIEAQNRWITSGTPLSTAIKDLKGPMKCIGFEYVDKMFEVFKATHNHVAGTSHTTRRRFGRNQGYQGRGIVGDFLFTFRNVILRHSIKQRHRGTSTELMALPPKVERTITVAFSPQEEAEYKEVERIARESYESLKAREGNKLTKHYLVIFQKLMPLRMACSGGEMKVEEDDDDEADESKAYQMEQGADPECSICLEQLSDPVATKCRPVPHVFCRDCIQGVIGALGESSGPCPLCRENVTMSSLCRAQLPRSGPDQEDMAAANMSGKGFIFKSKFDQLVQELKRIRDSEQHAKSLIFSQFTTTLKWLQAELPKHGFQYRTLSGDMPLPKRAKALRDFQNDPPTTIFLLSMRAGAVGINLTQANRVFVLEPAANPALEAQAIGRVHRLGQKRNVEVIRMFMRDSVETRMAEVLRKKYGNAATGHAGGPDADDAADESGACTPKSASSPANVGHLRTDKAAMMIEEFDILFGCAAAPAAAAASHENVDDASV